MSSGFSYPQPTYTSPIYNPAFYLTLDASGYLTYDYAKTVFLQIGGNASLASIVCAGNATIGGTLTAATLSITNITATNITGTLLTAAQPNITSLGTLTALSIDGNLTFTGASRTITGLTSLTATTINATTIQQSGISYNLSSFLTAVPSTLSLTSCTATTLSCTNLYQGGTAYSLSSFLTSVPSTISITNMTASTINCTTLNQGGISYNLSTFMSTGGSPTFANITCSTLTCTTNTYKADLRLSPISGAYGFRCYDTQTSDYPAMSFYTANRRSGVITEYRTYFNDLSTQTIYGSPLRISFQEGSGVSSGFRIATQNVGSQTTSNSNIMIGSGQYPQMMTFDGYLNRVHIQSYDLVNTNYNVKCIIGDGSGIALWVRGKTSMLTSGGAIGDGLLNLLDGTNGSTQVMMRIGNTQSTNNSMSINWKPVGDGNSSNYVSFDPYGTSNALTINCNGRVAIGTAAPLAGLHVATTNNITIGAGGTASAYAYNVQNNTWSNFGLGPYIASSVSAYFAGHIYINTGIWTASDRRLKEDIAPISITLEHFDQLNPVSYCYKGEKNVRLGLIAQDAMKVSREMISFFPNENLAAEEDDDIEGVQYTVDYQALGALNAAAIKLLIKEIKKLKEKIATLI